MTVLDGPDGIEQMADVLRETGHPDFVTLMVSESAGAREFSGVEGFKEALSDWISPYESFRLEVEDVLQQGRQPGLSGAAGGDNEARQPWRS